MKAKFILAAVRLPWSCLRRSSRPWRRQPAGRAGALARRAAALVEQGRARIPRSCAARARVRGAEGRAGTLLREARQRQRAMEQTSEQLEASSSRTTIEIGTLNQQLNDSLGELRELFGVVQLVAGDAASQLETSLTSLQFEGRREFLLGLAERMGQSARIASVEELERLWFELQREATELGRSCACRWKSSTSTATAACATSCGSARSTSFRTASTWPTSRRPAPLAELVRQPDQRRFIASTSDS
jgi:biopolymer transport protein ExbB